MSSGSPKRPSGVPASSLTPRSPAGISVFRTAAQLISVATQATYQVDRETLYIDQMAIDAVGRLGGHLYARQLDQFERVTPTVEQFMATCEPSD